MVKKKKTSQATASYATKNVSTFEKIAGKITTFTGSGSAFMIALVLILIWCITGPVFHYSETWQLVINTGTTIITFLMVFIIQHSQNKDTLALQLKLNELILAIGGASNELVDAENLCEDDLKKLKEHYGKVSTSENSEAKNILTKAKPTKKNSQNKN